VHIVLATNNKDKIREIKQLLEDLPVTIMTADDFQNFPDIEETGATLEANARLKANGIAKFTQMAALADDSGLEVDALGGAPGVYSSRYAGENATYEDNNHKLLKDLQGVHSQKRMARFRCVIAIDWGDGTTEICEGRCDGFITEDVVGHEGFGYDPIFYYPPADKRFSEMSVAEKNLVSHRGLALEAAKELIRERLSRSLS
jgi:XTP/dITP diphosphohydrolase